MTWHVYWWPCGGMSQPIDSQGIDLVIPDSSASITSGLRSHHMLFVCIQVFISGCQSGWQIKWVAVTLLWDGAAGCCAKPSNCDQGDMPYFVFRWPTCQRRGWKLEPNSCQMIAFINIFLGNILSTVNTSINTLCVAKCVKIQRNVAQNALIKGSLNSVLGCDMLTVNPIAIGCHNLSCMITNTPLTVSNEAFMDDSLIPRLQTPPTTFILLPHVYGKPLGTVNQMLARY